MGRFLINYSFSVDLNTVKTLNGKFGVSAWTWKNDIWFEYIEVTGEHTFWYTATQMCDLTNESLKYGMLLIQGWILLISFLLTTVNEKVTILHWTTWSKWTQNMTNKTKSNFTCMPFIRFNIIEFSEIKIIWHSIVF